MSDSKPKDTKIKSVRVRIDHISIKNFRGIDSAKCSFKNLNFIVGDNGSGKTTLLASISRFLPTLRSEERLFIDGDLHFKQLDSAEPVEIHYNFSLINEGQKQSNSIKIEASRSIKGINRSFLNNQSPANTQISHFDHGISNEDVKNLSQRIIRNGWSGGRVSPIITKTTDKTQHAATSKREEQGYVDSLRARIVEIMKGSELSNTVQNEHPDLEVNVINYANKILGEQRFDRFQLGFGDQLCISRVEGPIIPWMGLSGGEQSILNIAMAIELEKNTQSQLLFLEEPETNIHPTIQQKIIPAVIEHFPNTQIFVSTHSPYIFQDHLENANIIITKNNGFVNVKNLESGKTIFKKPSWGEISYLAYNLVTFEYHNELFGVVQKLSTKKSVMAFDKWLNENFEIPQNKEWIHDQSPDKPKKMTAITYIRNYTHHPENELNTEYTNNELKYSIESLRMILERLKKCI